MSQLDIDTKQIKPKIVAYMIAQAKNNLISSSKFSEYYSGYIEDIVSQIYKEYEKRLISLNAVDFGGILFKLVELFENQEDILRKYQNKFKYIHIDEYQDTNKAQYVLSKMLAGMYNNICVVGDDDQGIYAWRGADIDNIISFEKDFDDVTVVKLEQNYRSTRNIISAAVSIITKNNNRVEKRLWTEQSDGDTITVYQAKDERNEAEFVVDEIQRWVQFGGKLKDIAILYRTNYQSRSVEEALLQAGIPYKLIGGFRFYERKEIKDILSYLKSIFNPDDIIATKRIVNTPTRKI